MQTDAKLNEKYGTLWTDIENVINEMKKLTAEQSALSYDNYDSPEYFSIADQLVGLAEELKLAETDSTYAYTEYEIDELINTLLPDDFDFAKNKKLLKNKIDFLYAEFGDVEFLNKFTNGKKGNEAVDDILSRTVLTSNESIKLLINQGPEAIFNSDDPFIKFVQISGEESKNISMQIDELTVKETITNQKLGRAIFEVYGTSIPPDATFTLRISDGIVKGFNYNGTFAPPITTFYGMLDRYYSFDGKFRGIFTNAGLMHRKNLISQLRLILWLLAMLSEETQEAR